MYIRYITFAASDIRLLFKCLWSRYTVPPLPNGLRIQASIPMAVSFPALRVLLPPLKDIPLSFWPPLSIPPSPIRIIKGLNRPRSPQMFTLLTPISLIYRHRHP